MPPTVRTQTAQTAAKMTVDSIEKALLGAGITEAKAEAYILAEHFLSVPRSRLVLMRDEELSSPELERAVARRIKREPLAYITGRAYFMNEVYRVTPDCLIPRPETELLVLEAEKALRDFASAYRDENAAFSDASAGLNDRAASAAADGPDRPLRVLDLCTGSGCVAVSLLKRCDNITADALDISAPAAALCAENAVSNGVGERIRVICADMFAWTPDDAFPSFAVITANPPYVTAAEMETLDPELYFEPSSALTDGGDGLSFVRELCSRYAGFILPGGALLCEIGCAEGKAALEIARGAGLDGQIIRDLSGLDRILKITV